jgi:hypothetical protein
MKNRFLTIGVLKFLYRMARIRTKPYKKHNVMYMDEKDYEKTMEIVKLLNTK